MAAPAALPCAIFLLLAFAFAGVAHVVWLKSSWSQPYAWPLDGGATWRGRRIFGDNKTMRGLMMMPLATAFAFAAFAALREQLPVWLAAGIWPLPAGEMAWLGAIAGLAFLLAELPNSFLKRRLDVAPGMAPEQPWLRVTCLVIDRCDSTLGVLLALGLLVPLAPATWFWALLLGIGLHALFSAWLFQLRIKRRAL